MTLLDRIEMHLISHRISATRFGRRAVGDPRFVLDLRLGRRPRRRTLERLNAYLEWIESGKEGKALRRSLVFLPAGETVKAARNLPP